MLTVPSSFFNVNITLLCCHRKFSATLHLLIAAEQDVSAPAATQGNTPATLGPLHA